MSRDRGILPIILAARAAGKDVKFQIPMLPVQNFGFVPFVRFTSSGDEEQQVECTIDELRYKLKDNYKITLKAVNQEQFSYEHYYIMDLESLMRRNPELYVLLIDGEKVPYSG